VLASGRANEDGVNVVVLVGERLSEGRVALAIGTRREVVAALLDGVNDGTNAELAIAEGVLEVDGTNAAETDDAGVHWGQKT